MPLPTDPLLSSQWHLIQTVPGLFDLNVLGVWNPAEGLAYSGAGITTVVIDDGFDYTHPDFDNYDQSLDFDFEFNSLDPFGTAANARASNDVFWRGNVMGATTMFPLSHPPLSCVRLPVLPMPAVCSAGVHGGAPAFFLRVQQPRQRLEHRRQKQQHDRNLRSVLRKQRSQGVQHEQPRPEDQARLRPTVSIARNHSVQARGGLQRRATGDS